MKNTLKFVVLTGGILSNAAFGTQPALVPVMDFRYETQITRLECDSYDTTTGNERTSIVKILFVPAQVQCTHISIGHITRHIDPQGFVTVEHPLGIPLRGLQWLDFAHLYKIEFFSANGGAATLIAPPNLTKLEFCGEEKRLNLQACNALATCTVEDCLNERTLGACRLPDNLSRLRHVFYNKTRRLPPADLCNGWPARFLANRPRIITHHHAPASGLRALLKSRETSTTAALERYGNLLFTEFATPCCFASVPMTPP
ncbi:MAG: hypothetical protein LBL99_03970 [Holosporaceae bacterium]|jgi:hypothetical protein|nr:hypothetical protein [Holosporaceae bacterium]